MPFTWRGFVTFSAIMFCCFYNSVPGTFAQTQNNLPTEKWQPLFDGKTLIGWKASEPGYFTVEDGAITGKVAREHDGPVQRVEWKVGSTQGGDKRQVAPFLVWQGSNVTNFRLRFKTRLTGGVAHCGIYFRSQIKGQELIGGYQADIPEMGGFFSGLLGKGPSDSFAAWGQSNLITPSGEKMGIVFGEAQDFLEKVNFRQWTEYEISARGPHIVLEINGRKIAELIDQRKETANPSGILALALSPLSEMKVQVKDIEMKTLSPRLADARETADIIKNINVLEQIKTELGTGSAQKALALLKQHPSLVNTISGRRTGATYSMSTNETSLLIASGRGHSEVVRWLLENGAAINQAGVNNYLPIHGAANAEVAKLLIAAGANLQALTSFGYTPLQFAIEEKRMDVVKAILESGYKLDLVSAVLLGQSDLVAKILKENPAAVNEPKLTARERTLQRRETPLMVAVRRGETKIVELLLNAGAEVNDKYNLVFISGGPHCGTVTALSIAVVLQRIELIELLLQHGATPHVDCDGSSLLEYARKHRTPEIVTLLEKEWPRKPQ